MSFEKKKRPQSLQQAETKETEAQKLIRLGEDGTYFVDEIGEAFVEIEEDGRKHTMKVNSKHFTLFLGRRFYKGTAKPASPDAIKQAIHHFQSIALFDGRSKKLSRRVAVSKSGYVWYSLADDQASVVRITPDEWEVYPNGPSLFYQTANTAPQVFPERDSNTKLLRLLAKHFPTRSREDLFLIAVYIVTCFIPDIPHPLLVLSGEKGAAKSTTMRMIRAIVDPAKSDLLAMPNSTDNLVVILNNNYMAGFDNLDYLTPERSDLLCIAATGGTISKRKLYTNDEESFLHLQRCVMLNGINTVVTRSDLLDRSIIVTLKRILAENRKDEDEVWSQFHVDLPKILGACFDLLSHAMAIFPKVRLARKPRMADFAKWGFAIGEAFGGLGNAFLEQFEENQKQASQEILQSNPIAMAVMKLMEDKEVWEGTPTYFYSALESICMQNAIRLSGKNWPESPNALTRRMNNLKSNLEQMGITFESRKSNDRRVILTNANAVSGEFSPRKQKSRKKPSKPFGASGHERQ